jgi:hypothetical protein
VGVSAVAARTGGVGGPHAFAGLEDLLCRPDAAFQGAMHGGRLLPVGGLAGEELAAAAGAAPQPLYRALRALAGIGVFFARPLYRALRGPRTAEEGSRMLLRQSTPLRNLPVIVKAGLLCSKSQGKRPIVLLHAPSRTGWAVLHTVKRHGGARR